MKLRKFFAILVAVFVLCVPVVNVYAADYATDPDYPGIDVIDLYGQDIAQGYADGLYQFVGDDLYDLNGNQIPLAAAAPATGIDQSELAMQRAFDVVIFGLGISLASVISVTAIKKHNSKSK
jgi:hypothetical protein